MNELPILLRHLEAYVQEEIGVQGRLAALLDEQQRAVQSTEPAAIAKTTRTVEDELTSTGPRARRRDALLKGFARFWSVDAASLTLSSVIERAGPAAERLQRQRVELRKATGQVARRARLIAMAAREHRKLTGEMISTILAAGEERNGHGADVGGSLVNAEA